MTRLVGLDLSAELEVVVSACLSSLLELPKTKLLGRDLDFDLDLSRKRENTVDCGLDEGSGGGVADAVCTTERGRGVEEREAEAEAEDEDGASKVEGVEVAGMGGRAYRRLTISMDSPHGSIRKKCVVAWRYHGRLCLVIQFQDISNEGE